MSWLLVGIYVLILLGCGYVSMKKTRDVNDFFLGGRGVGPWLSAFAYGTTYFSAVLFIGYAGKVGWGFGLSSLWIVVGNAFFGTFLAWKVLAKATRRMTTRLNVMTMPEFLEARYKSPAFKIFAALVIFVFLVPYSASVYMGLSYLFEQVFHLDYTYALILMAALTTIYLVMGGYLAVALADLIQGFVMIFGAIMLFFYISNSGEVGGLMEGIRRLKEINPLLVTPVGPPGWLPLVSLVVLTSLGTWGLPQMVQKFYAIKDEKSIKPAMWVSTIFALIISSGAYFTGSFSQLFKGFLQRQGIDPAINPNHVDMIIPAIIPHALPEIGAAIILVLVLSASMSTLASLVLVSSSAISIDLIKGRLAPNLSRESSMVLMRSLCVVFVALSLYLAMLKPSVILTLMALSWGTVSGTFLAPYLYGLFWRRTTKIGAWIASLTGFGIAIGASAYLNFDPALMGKNMPLIGSAAMIVPLLALPLVNSFGKPFENEHLEKVFGQVAKTSIKQPASKELEIY